MKKVLITGFEPFDGDSVNNSWIIAQEVYKKWKNNGKPDPQIVIEELPVSWRRTGPALAEAVTKHQPDYLICMGLDGSVSYLCFETTALNEASDGLDNDDKQFTEGQRGMVKPMYPDYDYAYRSTLPEKWLFDNFPDYAEKSKDAGGYLCNFAFFHAMTRFPQILKKGFIHVTGNRSKNEDCAEILLAMCKQLLVEAQTV